MGGAVNDIPLRKKSEVPPVIIPAWLDDAGLRATPFRVLCRIARRGNCFESLDSMAEGCRLRRVTVQRALQELLELGFITAEPRPGRTTVFKLKKQPTPNKALGL